MEQEQSTGAVTKDLPKGKAADTMGAHDDRSFGASADKPEKATEEDQD